MRCISWRVLLLLAPAALLCMVAGRAHAKPGHDARSLPTGRPPLVDRDEFESPFDASCRLYKEAVAHKKRGDYANAIRSFKLSLEKNPLNTCSANGLAWLLLTCEDERFQDPERALGYAKQAVSGRGRNCGACWDTLAIALTRAGRHERAHICHLKAMTLSGHEDATAMDNYLSHLEERGGSSVRDLVRHFGAPEKVALLGKMGDRFRRNGATLEALDGYTLALLTAPDHPRAHVIHFRRALVWRSLGLNNMSYQDACISLEKASDFDQAYLLRAVILSEQSYFDEALEDMGKAVALSVRKDIALYNRAMIYLDAKRPRKAMQDLDRAIGLEPSFPISYYGRAKTLLKLESVDRAVSDLMKALELDPGFQEARKLLDRTLELQRKAAAHKSEPLAP